MQSLFRKVWGRVEEGIGSMGSSQSRDEVPSRSSRTHLPPVSSSSQSWPAEYEYETPVYQAPAPKRTLGRRLSRKYSHISDQFTSVEQVRACAYADYELLEVWNRGRLWIHVEEMEC